MKNTRRFFIMCLLLNVFIFDVEAHDGTVTISGTIQDNTCELATDSQNKTVEMGVLAVNQFTRKGNQTPEKAFSINLINCGPAASEASVTFSGTPDPQVNTLYSLDHSSDAATGIALGIYDSNAQPIAPGAQSLGVALEPGQTSVELAFTARYVSVDDNVEMGSANVYVTFIVNYA
ncbi:TPA: fimbrial protein [Enterobacter asburiae]|jgi:type 1 fimbria pilin|nr:MULTISPECIES: fimbrial protein [Enterobacter]MDU4482835.1 fimbrial protein [Enterobacter sp.]BBW44812.1 fimbrial protein BcfF [Enterobacter cloacae]EHN8757564.1 fimbrial protein [Enterobacter asburiae]EKS6754436.1 fimbrial protein [Enterobacter asburiae]EUL41615.1 hypothetical protein P852_01000 [Enterobacter asburiae]